MSTNITMPALTPTMEEGTIVKWMVKEGDKVQAGDVIAEIETDKTILDIEVVEGGIVSRLVIQEGTEGVPVDAVIAVIVEEGEEPENIETDEEGIDKQHPSDENSSAINAMEQEHGKHEKEEISAIRQSVSPVAKRLAIENDIDLATISGSGPNGRIQKQDIEAVLRVNRQETAGGKTFSTISSKTAATTEEKSFEEVNLTGLRKVTARRLQESKQTIPHFYLSVDIEIDALLTLRNELNLSSEIDNKLSINDFIIRGAALALHAVPSVNVQFADDKLIYFKHADISVAVAVTEGLVTPVVRRAESKSLAEISKEIRYLTEKAHARRLMPEEYQGGTFTISNLGMYGIKAFDAVINAPQGGILAIGQGAERAVVKNGQVTVATVMTTTLSCDHRAIDGVAGAEFLNTVKKFLEDPQIELFC